MFTYGLFVSLPDLVEVTNSYPLWNNSSSLVTHNYSILGHFHVHLINYYSNKNSWIREVKCARKLYHGFRISRSVILKGPLLVACLRIPDPVYYLNYRFCLSYVSVTQLCVAMSLIMHPMMFMMVLMLWNCIYAFVGKLVWCLIV